MKNTKIFLMVMSVAAVILLSLIPCDSPSRAEVLVDLLEQAMSSRNREANGVAVTGHTMP